MGGGDVRSCHDSLTILVQLILIIPALNAFPQDKTANETATARSADYSVDYITESNYENPSLCCSQIEVSVASNTGFIVNYQDTYNEFRKDTDGNPVAWVSASSVYAIWFIPSWGSWVIANKSLIDSYNQPEARSLEAPIPPQNSGRSDNIAECPVGNSHWYWLNENDNKWEFGDDELLQVNCAKRVGEVIIVVLTASYPVPYGMQFTGLYVYVSDLSINGYPVYKHEFYKLYLIRYKEKYVFSMELDVPTEGWTLELRGNNLWVWNIAQREFLYDASYNIYASDILEEARKLEKNTVSENFACKLQISSKGKLGQVFPDQFGIYKLIENVTVYNIPIWKHLAKDFYLRVNEVGEWIVTSCKDTCNYAFFGRRTYNGASLLLNSTWFHNDGEEDIVNNIGFFEDNDVIIKDVCDGTYDIPQHQNSRKQNRKREKQKIVEEFKKHENEINNLEISERKKNMFKENYRIFKDLKLQKLKPNQLEVVNHAEDVIEQWKQYEALIFESELNVLKKKRRKREISQSCCSQVRITKSGKDTKFPISHEPYFGPIYTLQSESVNNFNFYSAVPEKNGKTRTIKHCKPARAWMVGIKETAHDSCEGSFYFPSDELCLENLPSIGWGFAIETNSGKEWPLTSLDIRVECLEEMEAGNDEVIISQDPEPEDDYEHSMLKDIFKLVDKLNQVSTYVGTEENRPRCSPEADEAFKTAEKLVSNLEKRLEAITSVGNTNKMRKRIVRDLKNLLAFQFPELYPGISSENFEPPSKKCFLEWGRRLLNNVLESKYTAIVEGVEKPQDCLKYCKARKDICSAWTFDENDKFCYLKTPAMAARFSETWESNIYSGQVEKCTSEDMQIKWTRQCKLSKYQECINVIKDSFENEIETETTLGPVCDETNSENDLNGIGECQRLKHDTLYEELECFFDFCPWTPEMNYQDLSKRYVNASTRLQAEILGEGDHCITDPTNAGTWNLAQINQIQTAIEFNKKIIDAQSPALETDIPRQTRAFQFNKTAFEINKLLALDRLTDKLLALDRYPAPPKKAKYCHVNLLTLVLESENSFIKSDSLSVYAEDNFNLEILPQLTVEEGIYFSHLLKEKAIEMMEEAQKPEIDIEDTQKEESLAEASSGGVENNQDSETDETLDTIKETLEDAKNKVEQLDQLLEKAKIITANVSPSNTGSCRKGRSLNFHKDFLSCAIREVGNELGFSEPIDAITDQIKQQQGQQQTTTQRPGQQQQSGNINDNDNNTGNNEEDKFKKKTKKVQSIRKAVKKFKSDNPDTSFNERDFRQNVRSEVMKFDKVVKMKQQFSNYNKYIPVKQKTQRRIRKAQGITSNVGEGIGHAIAITSAIKSGDGLEIANSAIGMLAFGAAFFPPVGTAVAALAGIATTILGFFGGAPSDAEVIGGLIEEQTAHIEGLIEEQTEILLKSISKLAEQQAKLADNIVREILIENYYQMMDDIHGVNSALKIKMEHINLYKDTCVLSWTDISTEADMQQVNLQFGRIGSYMSRFCANRPNIGYCGELIFQYVLMASLRDMVRTAAFSIVYRSNFVNHDVKYGALIREYKKAQEMDQRILKPILTDTSVKSPYCHVTCAFRNEKNNAANDLDEVQYNETSIKLTQPKRDTINSFLRSVGITTSHHEEQRYDDCTRCYQFNVNCKKHADEDKKPPGPHYNGRKDGKCITKTLKRKNQKCATIADHARHKDQFIITIKPDDHGVKRYPDTRKMWKHGNKIENIKVETNCYVKVYPDYNFQDEPEIFSNSEDEKFLREAIYEEFKKFKLQDPPEDDCTDYWDPKAKYGPNYICSGGSNWGDWIYSLECFCLDYDVNETYEDREEESKS